MTNNTRITIAKSNVLANVIGDEFIKVFILNKNYVQDSLKEFIKSILQENYNATKQKHKNANQIYNLVNGEYYIPCGDFYYKIIVEGI